MYNVPQSEFIKRITTAMDLAEQELEHDNVIAAYGAVQVSQELTFFLLVYLPMLPDDLLRRGMELQGRVNKALYERYPDA